jgi:hypothetical protein
LRRSKSGVTGYSSFGKESKETLTRFVPTENSAKIHESPEGRSIEANVRRSTCHGIFTVHM